MAEEQMWSATIKGFVLSSFFYGYLATQICGGFLADYFGGKYVLGVGTIAIYTCLYTRSLFNTHFEIIYILTSIIFFHLLF